MARRTRKQENKGVRKQKINKINMKLIITRHGETEESVGGILMGHLPGILTINGTNQAKKLALRLKDGKIDFI